MAIRTHNFRQKKMKALGRVLKDIRYMARGNMLGLQTAKHAEQARLPATQAAPFLPQFWFVLLFRIPALGLCGAAHLFTPHKASSISCVRPQCPWVVWGDTQLSDPPCPTKEPLSRTFIAIDRLPTPKHSLQKLPGKRLPTAKPSRMIRTL